MSHFQTCLNNVLEAEKGFVDHPLDRGGPTNLGITIRTLSAYLGRQATIEEIKALTPETVAPIYRKLFWDPMRLEEFPPDLALVVFNQCVLRGPPSVTKTLQHALKVVPDGKIGPQTLQSVRTAGNPGQLTFDFLRESLTTYIRICQADPSQLVFLAGWVGRVMELMAQKFR